MKIIEARDGFINFEADESIYLSSFIQAAGMDKTYVAQVNQMKKFGKILIASARILFLYNGTELVEYDRTLPARDSELSIFPLNIIQNSVKAKQPIVVGKTLDNSNNIFMDLSAFNKRTLISVDDTNAHNTLVSNLSKQFKHSGKKIILVDTLGVIKGDKKYFAAKDFKLPLDTSTLEFMYKSCLNDATEDSKATIAEVFSDLSEYSKTVPFVPFGVLKSIVDEMVDKQHIFRLFVLKNRLANFEKLGYFASDKSEADKLEKILASESAIIDLSKLNPLFQNKFLEFIYSKIDAKNTQVILELSNTVSKKNLKTVIVDSELPTLVMTHSKYQYLNDIKDMFKNFIIEPSFVNNEVFRNYITFLSSMKNGMYLTAGEDVNYVPMVSVFQNIDEFVEVSEKTISETENEESQLQDEENIDTLEDLTNNQDKEIITVEESADKIDTSDDQEKYDEYEGPTQEEIIAEIEEKSNGIIDSISKELEEPAEIDLFGGESDEEETGTQSEVIEDELQEKDSIDEISEESEQTEDVIEPEYEEAIEQTEPEIDEDDISDSLAEELPVIEEEQTTEQQEEEEQLIQPAGQEDVLIEETELIDEDLAQNYALNEDSNSDEEAEPEEILLEDNSDDALDNIAEYDDNASIELPNGSEDEGMFAEGENTNDVLSEEEDISIELSGDEELFIEEMEETEPVSEAPELSEKDKSSFIEPSIIPLDGEEYNQNYDDEPKEEFVSENDVKEDDIIIDMTDENGVSGIDEDVDRQIVEDVDKVFTTIKTEEELEEISDSDLDLIDALNGDDEELEEYQGELEEVSSDVQVDEGILEQPSEGIVPPRQHSQLSENNEILEKKESNTPIVPVYDADIPQEDMVVSDTIQQGDSVVHAKYGNGVVEKMIKYGTKTLFSINFENVGRRLLDPTLTEIKKL